MCKGPEARVSLGHVRSRRTVGCGCGRQWVRGDYRQRRLQRWTEARAHGPGDGGEVGFYLRRSGNCRNN